MNIPIDNLHDLTEQSLGSEAWGNALSQASKATADQQCAIALWLKEKINQGHSDGRSEIDTDADILSPFAQFISQASISESLKAKSIYTIIRQTKDLDDTTWIEESFRSLPTRWNRDRLMEHLNDRKQGQEIPPDFHPSSIGGAGITEVRFPMRSGRDVRREASLDKFLNMFLNCQNKIVLNLAQELCYSNETDLLFLAPDIQKIADHMPENDHLRPKMQSYGMLLSWKNDPGSFTGEQYEKGLSNLQAISLSDPDRNPLIFAFVHVLWQRSDLNRFPQHVSTARTLANTLPADEQLSHATFSRLTLAEAQAGELTADRYDQGLKHLEELQLEAPTRHALVCFFAEHLSQRPGKDALRFRSRVEGLVETIPPDDAHREAAAASLRKVLTHAMRAVSQIPLSKKDPVQSSSDEHSSPPSDDRRAQASKEFANFRRGFLKKTGSPKSPKSDHSPTR